MRESEIEYGKVYDYEEVKEIVRQRQLYILDSIVAICEKHNLTYWLDGGTLLGAIRHKGFIPWDDDIDIGLMREDYDKLLKILSKELSKDLVLQSRATDKYYKLPFVKIRDRYSQIESSFKFNGIFIDIFPFDPMPKAPLLKKVQKTLFVLLEVMFIHTDINSLNISNKRDLKSKLIRLVMKSLSSVGSLLGESIFLKLYKMTQDISKLSKSDEVGDGLTASWAYYKSIRPKDVYLTTKNAFFETKEYRVPNDSDAYLKTLYGANYMTPLKTDILHMEKVVFLHRDEASK